MSPIVKEKFRYQAAMNAASAILSRGQKGVVSRIKDEPCPDYLSKAHLEDVVERSVTFASMLMKKLEATGEING